MVGGNAGPPVPAQRAPPVGDRCGVGAFMRTKLVRTPCPVESGELRSREGACEFRFKAATDSDRKAVQRSAMKAAGLPI